MAVFMGDDWAEDHHDVHLMDEDGRKLVSRRLPEGLDGIRVFHELVADHVIDPQDADLRLCHGRRSLPHTREVTVLALSRAPSGRNAAAVDVARRLVTTVGGRYSTELGIDVDRGDDEVERWFLAATLFGARISAGIASRTFLVFDRAGITRVARARYVPWDDLVALLDEGGYARYDFRTATRLQALATTLDGRYGDVAAIGRRFPDYAGLRDALDALPGWGLVTVGLFLRELRGVWRGAEPPVDDRAAQAARHLGLSRARRAEAVLDAVARTATDAGLDLRDLESALVRLSLAHHAGMDDCPGGPDCSVLAHHSRREDTP